MKAACITTLWLGRWAPGERGVRMLAPRAPGGRTTSLDATTGSLYYHDSARAMPATRKVVRRTRRDDSSDDERDDRRGGGHDDDEDPNTLAAFSTRSRGGMKETRMTSKAAPSATVAKVTRKTVRTVPVVEDQHELIIPDVGSLKGMEEIELCEDPKAGLDRHFEDMEKLLTAFDKVVHGNASLLTKAVAFTEARVQKSKNAERKAAVEAALQVAEQAAERKLAAELRHAVTQAVAESRAAAQVAQEAAVAEAVKLAEERSVELQRLAVQNVTSTYQRAVGRPEEEIIATRTTSSFQEAANAAAMALAASTRLDMISRDSGDVASELLSSELDSGRSEAARPAPTSDAALHFF